MGVLGLWQLLDGFSEITLPELWSGKRIAIDTSIWLVQLRSTSNDSDIEDQHVYEGILLRILQLLYYGIKPVFVFDGLSSGAKRLELRRRQMRRDQYAKAQRSRKAKAIVSAQLAAGILNFSELSPIPTTKEKSPSLVSNSSAHHASSPSSSSSKVCSSPPLTFEHSVPLRNIHPSCFSRQQTAAFIHQAHTTVSEVNEGRRKQSANLLGDVSGALFLGPRHALQFDDKSSDVEIVDSSDSSVRSFSPLSSDNSSVVSYHPSPSRDLSPSANSLLDCDELNQHQEVTLDSLLRDISSSYSFSSSSTSSAAPLANEVPLNTSYPFSSTGKRAIFSGDTKNTIPYRLVPIIELLECCGIDYIISPGEADAQCAFLSRTGRVDAVFSEDSDVIVHGAAVILRGFFHSSRTSSKPVRCYRAEAWQKYGLSREILIALAYLRGCDYGAGGVGGMSTLHALRTLTAIWKPYCYSSSNHSVTISERSLDYDSEEWSEYRSQCLSEHVRQLVHHWIDLYYFFSCSLSDASIKKNSVDNKSDKNKAISEIEERGKSILDEISLLQRAIVQVEKISLANAHVPEGWTSNNIIEAFCFPPLERTFIPFSEGVVNWERVKEFSMRHGILTPRVMNRIQRLTQLAFNINEQPINSPSTDVKIGCGLFKSFYSPTLDNLSEKTTDDTFLSSPYGSTLRMLSCIKKSCLAKN